MWIAVVPIAALLLVNRASAEPPKIDTQCPRVDTCFSINIPSSTAASGVGDLYVQIIGPTTNSRIALAIGDNTAETHFCAVYLSADGTTITISPRLTGVPTSQADLDNKLELLEGSGVQSGKITANIKCSNCTAWINGGEDINAETTKWTWGSVEGSSTQTPNPSTSDNILNVNGLISFNSSARGGDDVNPFVKTAAASPIQSGGGAKVSYGPPRHIVILYTTHAVLACLAWAAIFPIGGIMIRLLSFPHLVWVHAILQIFGFCMYVAAVGLGIILSINPKYWRMHNKHVVIGLLIFVLFFIQIFTGYLHHLMYKKYGGRSIWSVIHLLSGRVCITLGIINAGFGFQITHKTMKNWEVKLYTICAAIVWVAYVVSVVVGERQREMRKRAAAKIALSPNSPEESSSDTQSRKETVYIIDKTAPIGRLDSVTEKHVF